MFERNDEGKCFPEYVQRNTSHDGYSESQVPVAKQVWEALHVLCSFGEQQ